MISSVIVFFCLLSICASKEVDKSLKMIFKLRVKKLEFTEDHEFIGKNEVAWTLFFKSPFEVEDKKCVTKAFSNPGIWTETHTLLDKVYELPDSYSVRALRPRVDVTLEGWESDSGDRCTAKSSNDNYNRGVHNGISMPRYQGVYEDLGWKYAPVNDNDYGVYLDGYWRLTGPRNSTIYCFSPDTFTVPDLHTTTSYGYYYTNAVAIYGTMRMNFTAGTTKTIESLRYTRLRAYTRLSFYGTLEIFLRGYKPSTDKIDTRSFTTVFYGYSGSTKNYSGKHVVVRLDALYERTHIAIGELVATSSGDKTTVKVTVTPKSMTTTLAISTMPPPTTTTTEVTTVTEPPVTCPSDCSGHGMCISQDVCQCDSGYTDDVTLGCALIPETKVVTDPPQTIDASKGCTLQQAKNYVAGAVTDDGSCRIDNDGFVFDASSADDVELASYAHHGDGAVLRASLTSEHVDAAHKYAEAREKLKEDPNNADLQAAVVAAYPDNAPLQAEYLSVDGGLLKLTVGKDFPVPMDDKSVEIVVARFATPFNWMNEDPNAIVEFKGFSEVSFDVPAGECLQAGSPTVEFPADGVGFLIVPVRRCTAGETLQPTIDVTTVHDMQNIGPGTMTSSDDGTPLWVWIVIGVGALCCILLVVGLVLFLRRRRDSGDEDDWRGASDLVMSERPGESLKENDSLATPESDAGASYVSLQTDGYGADETQELQRNRSATEKSVPAGSYTSEVDGEIGAYGGAGFDVQDKVNY